MYLSKMKVYMWLCQQHQQKLCEHTVCNIISISKEMNTSTWSCCRQADLPKMFKLQGMHAVMVNCHNIHALFVEIFPKLYNCLCYSRYSSNKVQISTVSSIIYITHLHSTRIIQLRENLDKHRMDIMAVDHNGMYSWQFEHFLEDLSDGNKTRYRCSSCC